MRWKERIKNWFLSSTIGSITVANGLVFLSAFLQKTQTYEPGFLAATTGILVVIHSITRGRFTAVAAGLSAACSGFLWMRGSSESESPNLDTGLGILLILVLGLIIYGLLAFYIWLLTWSDRRESRVEDKDSSESKENPE